MASGDLPKSDFGGTLSSFGGGLSSIAGGIGDIGSLFTGKKTTQNTKNTKTLDLTTKETEEVSAEKAMALLSRVLGSTQGLAAIAQGEKQSGLYNSTVNQQLTNDLLARVSGEVAALSSVKTNTQTGSVVEDNTQTNKTKGALQWIICTELHKQGRMDSKLYDAGWPVFARTPVRVKAGYYIWAIPTVKHLRAHPYSWYSIMIASVMKARAEQIAAATYVTGAKKTVFGYLVLKGLYGMCWVLSRTVARKPIDFMSLYTK